MIFEAWMDISSQPIFSRRMTSGSFEWAVGGSIAFPVGPKPRICSKTADEREDGTEDKPLHDAYLHTHAGGPPALDLVFMPE